MSTMITTEKYVKVIGSFRVKSTNQPNVKKLILIMSIFFLKKYKRI